jgi:hypothetical protein
MIVIVSRIARVVEKCEEERQKALKSAQILTQMAQQVTESSKQMAKLTALNEDNCAQVELSD